MMGIEEYEPWFVRFVFLIPVFVLIAICFRDL